MLPKGGSSHSHIFTATNHETILKIKKVIQSGLIKSQERRDLNALSDCTEFKNHIVIVGTIASSVAFSWQLQFPPPFAALSV